MKIRYGFVSNSSSCSFTVSLERYENVFALARHMIEIRNREWDNDGFAGRNNQVLENLDKAIKNKKDPNIPITFGTTNYDTYIVKSKDFYYVDTCNNHDWDDIPTIAIAFDEDVADVDLELAEFFNLFNEKMEQKKNWW